MTVPAPRSSRSSRRTRVGALLAGAVAAALVTVPAPANAAAPAAAVTAATSLRCSDVVPKTSVYLRTVQPPLGLRYHEYLVFSWSGVGVAKFYCTR